jgi:hypothetical protein
MLPNENALLPLTASAEMVMSCLSYECAVAATTSEVVALGSDGSAIGWVRRAVAKRVTAPGGQEGMGNGDDCDLWNGRRRWNTTGAPFHLFTTSITLFRYVTVRPRPPDARHNALRSSPSHRPRDNAGAICGMPRRQLRIHPPDTIAWRLRSPRTTRAGAR